MGQKFSPTVVPTLEEVKHRFTAWRSTERKGRRIPEALWNSATELAHEIGVNRVARALHLDYNKLKHRVAGQMASKTKISPTTTGPTFVELAVDAVSRCPECVVEFEGQRGKITIRLAEHNPVDIVALAEVLSRSEP